mmetsp:Transcript_90239/g.291782  ORF Transcript_90239/g.291782 Transcript_90239/m.291782 type:complete len:867 (+) Transcript_90239:96-2696(+)|eukprot:CAMPEP_0203868162 /NCGR_PEP_ID=MMETSP0359-20131031/16949_1 /ASSEMBLY_ACC=CAM_ASM_000338 /TAXON_ID=268821 /ORGANISM="Scrippsiella Hangoei, Strain SHTV-5" /LENGTH=866 /DNA_ID=CAMNT_0050786533 /DNA_START=64 /DNA_END=2664 /DNA_ORIENTATION=-
MSAGGLFGFRGFGVYESFVSSVPATSSSAPAGALEPVDGADAERPSHHIGTGSLGAALAAALAAAPSGSSPSRRRVVARCRPAGADAGRPPATGLPPARPLTAEEREAGVLVRIPVEGGADGAFRCDAYVGPWAGQRGVFREVCEVAQRAIEGQDCAVLCYGAAGSGKTHTFVGPLDSSGASCGTDPAGGLVQQFAQRLFECIEEQSLNGDVFVVEASFLQVCSSSSGTDELADLFSEGGPTLQVLPDPFNAEAYMVEGLRTVPVRTAAQIWELLETGLERHVKRSMELRRLGLPCAHCVLTFRVERMWFDEGMLDMVVRQGKVVLVDLAGSESIDETYDTEGCFSMLWAPAAPTQPNLVLMQILRQFLLEAYVLLIATICCAAENAAESAKTLAFAQQFASSSRICNIITELDGPCDEVDDHALPDVPATGPAAAAVVPPASSGGAQRAEMHAPSRAGAERHTLRLGEQSASTSSAAPQGPTRQSSKGFSKQDVQMLRERTAECVKLLQSRSDSGADTVASELQQNAAGISQQVAESEKIERVLEDAGEEQAKRLAEIKGEMTSSISIGLKQLQQQAATELEDWKQTMGKQLSVLEAKKPQVLQQGASAQVARLEKDIADALAARRAAEIEVVGLRERLASADMRSQLLLEGQEEQKQFRSSFGEEKERMRQQSESNREKLSQVERELHKIEAETQMHRSEFQRVTELQSKEAKEFLEERGRLTAREAELQRSRSALREELTGLLRARELGAVRTESDRREATFDKERQTQRLKASSESMSSQLEEATQQQAKLEVEVRVAQQREEQIKKESRWSVQQAHKELAAVKQKEQELEAMLHELTEGVLEANEAEELGAYGDDDAHEGA